MKFIFLFIIIKIITFISASLKRKSTKKNEQILIRRPYINRYRSVPIFRPQLVYPSSRIVSPPVLAVVRNHISECPQFKDDKMLVGRSTGLCKLPCNIKYCI